MGEQESGYVIMHNQLNHFWSGRVRWVNRLDKARVYHSRESAMYVCRRLNRQYGAVTAQCLTVDEARAKMGE